MDLQTLNDTSGIWACLQLQNSSLLNGTLNGSLEIPNGTCGDALLLPKTEPARPKGEDPLTHIQHQNAVSGSFKTVVRLLYEVPKPIMTMF